ncbi:uncharacterized protein LOC116105714 [Pistacia vera]|uniref:uncharacterized protein LOC116105714 n=1 Tax=Pistacia vera TaxID=55513 RepID=UPI0012636AE7|nr:uncharacterized protein LOC116105714 [Pistacia vera]
MGVTQPEGMNEDPCYQGMHDRMIYQTTPRGMTQQNVLRANAVADPVRQDDPVVSPSPIEQVLAKRLADVKAVMRCIPRMPVPTKKSKPHCYADSPFVDEIALADLPQKFTIPNMKMYNGTTDPDDHIASYKQRMFTVSKPRPLREACMCKSFGSSLSDPALQWCTNLPNGSIDSFAQLTDTFVEQFASSKKLEKLSADLYRVYQRRGKPLREYISRFNREKISIPACNPETTVDAFRKGLLLDGELYKELTKLGCTAMEDALVWAVIQIRWEEDEINRTIHSRYEPRRSDRKLEPGLIDTATTLQHVVAIIKGLGSTVKCPGKLHPEARRDTTKWCKFHNNHGHNTVDCIALRLEVAALLKRGHLRDLLTDKGKNTISQKSSKEPLPPPWKPTLKGFCSLIFGGSEISGVSYSLAKRYARANHHHEVQSIHPISRSHSHQVIQFKDDEPVTLAALYHDALVVSLQIANILVKRVFVDGGSLANILFLEAVKAMGLEEANINRRLTLLVGFSLEQKYTIGEIVLPIYAGRVNKQTVFLVIDCPSPYNVILGRPWIHDMWAVPSTFHQTIRFPTKWGVREIKGDLKASKDCYKNAFKSK